MYGGLWWPSMDKDIENITKFCTSCQIHQNMPLKAPMDSQENSQTPWGRIHLDFAGPYLGKMFLVITDSYCWTLFGKNVSCYYRFLFQMA